MKDSNIVSKCCVYLKFLNKPANLSLIYDHTLHVYAYIRFLHTQNLLHILQNWHSVYVEIITLYLFRDSTINLMLTQCLYRIQMYVLMRDEKEGRNKQARSNKQQGKATQHTQGSHFS